MPTNSMSQAAKRGEDLAFAMQSRKGTPRPPFPEYAWIVQHPDGRVDFSKGLTEWVRGMNWSLIGFCPDGFSYNEKKELIDSVFVQRGTEDVFKGLQCYTIHAHDDGTSHIVLSMTPQLRALWPRRETRVRVHLSQYLDIIRVPFPPSVHKRTRERLRVRKGHGVDDRGPIDRIYNFVPGDKLFGNAILRRILRIEGEKVVARVIYDNGPDTKEKSTTVRAMRQWIHTFSSSLVEAEES